MSRYKPYPQYKDSGVELLGDVPTHWEKSKLKYLTNKIIDGAHFTPTYVDSGVPFLRVTDIQQKNIDLNSVKFIPENEHVELSKRCKPEKGDVLLSKNGTIGLTKIVDWDFECSLFVSLCLIKFRQNMMEPSFFCYFFQSSVIDEQLNNSSKKTSVTNLHLDKISELEFTVPELPEQQKIAAFLDHETGKIDQLIEKQQNLIALLEEKRQAVISHAVTKGIDPTVPMKDSGVEWLGEIPMHWEVQAIKYGAELNPSCDTSKLTSETEVTFLPMEYVKKGYYNQNTAPFSKNASSYNLFQEEDILIAKVTPCFENGNITVARKLKNGIGFGSSELFVIRCQTLNTNFMFYYLQNTDFKNQGERSMSGAGGLKRVSSGCIQNHKMPLPPLEEQKAIFHYLDVKTKQFDELTAKAKSAIELMKERRTALISAAVTGKIDLRAFKVEGKEVQRD